MNRVEKGEEILSQAKNLKKEMKEKDYYCKFAT